jgi:sialate O-acetylesterase
MRFGNWTPTWKLAAFAAATLTFIGIGGGILGGGQAARAAMELPSVIGPNMVVERGQDVAVWGWDAPGTQVTVEFRGKSATAKAGDDGKFVARVAAGDAGGPFEMTIRGSEEKRLANVLVGEVWVAGGQSNMWFAVGNCRNAQAEIAAAKDFSTVRMWDANTGPESAGWRADTPQRTVKTEWKVASPETVGAMPGTAYFFARDLAKQLGVPVGIVHLAVPGAAIEPFMSVADVKAAQSPEVARRWQVRQDLYALEKALCPEAAAKWTATEAAAKAAGQKFDAPKPGEPKDPSKMDDAGQFYNGMIVPAAPFTARGFIWWQGEANVDRPAEYPALFAGLIRDWRGLWGDDKMPFIYAELHGAWTHQASPVEEEGWPVLRDAQRQVTKMLPGVYGICTIDILADEPNINNIHPVNKQLAGNRMFRVAMAEAYGDKTMVPLGPAPKPIEILNNNYDHIWVTSADGHRSDQEVTVTFDNVGGGLVNRGEGDLKGFAVAGEDHKWEWAKATIKGDHIVLTSDAVANPAAVRYNWGNYPAGQLYNAEGLPAAQFRSDDWPIVAKAPDTAKMGASDLAALVDKAIGAKSPDRAAWDGAYALMKDPAKRAEAAQALTALRKKDKSNDAALLKALGVLAEKVAAGK